MLDWELSAIFLYPPPQMFSKHRDFYAEFCSSILSKLPISDKFYFESPEIFFSSTGARTFGLKNGYVANGWRKSGILQEDCRVEPRSSDEVWQWPKEILIYLIQGFACIKMGCGSGSGKVLVCKLPFWNFFCRLLFPTIFPFARCQMLQSACTRSVSPRIWLFRSYFMCVNCWPNYMFRTMGWLLVFQCYMMHWEDIYSVQKLPTLYWICFQNSERSRKTISFDFTQLRNLWELKSGL